MQLGAVRSIERWAAAWARRRQGADPLAVALQPSASTSCPRFGVVFDFMVFAMSAR
jgi:hypothetical protein